MRGGRCASTGPARGFPVASPRTATRHRRPLVTAAAVRLAPRSGLQQSGSPQHRPRPESSVEPSSEHVGMSCLDRRSLNLCARSTTWNDLEVRHTSKRPPSTRSKASDGSRNDLGALGKHNVASIEGSGHGTDRAITNAQAGGRRLDSFVDPSLGQLIVVCPRLS